MSSRASPEGLAKSRMAKYSSPTTSPLCLEARGAERLRREARNLAAIRRDLGHHENIVAVRDLNVDVEPCWLAFEHVDGGTLDGEVRSHGGPVPTAEALRLFAGICRDRLPTEAEWEYLARAGTQTRFWSGPSDSDLDRAGWSWSASTSGGGAKRVETKDANPWRLFDVHGNVWEWCSDYDGPYLQGAATDHRRKFSDSPRAIARYRRSLDGFARFLREAGRARAEGERAIIPGQAGLMSDAR